MSKFKPVQLNADPVEKPLQKFYGRDLDRAPQHALTAANSSAITTGSVGAFVEAGNDVVIENMRTRINEIEGVLKNLGLIK